MGTAEVVVVVLFGTLISIIDSTGRRHRWASSAAAISIIIIVSVIVSNVLHLSEGSLMGVLREEGIQISSI